jgi:predicted thioesterase
LTFAGISALCGVAATVIAGTVTIAEFDTEVLNTEAAVMVTDKSLSGGVTGAV